MAIAHRKIIFAGILVVAALIPSLVIADLILMKIDQPEHLPAGLTIESKPGDDGMTRFDVYVDAEAIANNELYKGRSRSHAVLKIATAREQIASVVVQGSPERKSGGRTWYQFSVAPSAVENSELQVGVSLFEKDGMATLGGGKSMQIKLSGFEPKAKNADTKTK
jgi:hypothetical protein